MNMKKLKRKIKKNYMRALRAYSRGLIDKGYALEDKSIRLELELREEYKK